VNFVSEKYGAFLKIPTAGRHWLKDVPEKIKEYRRNKVAKHDTLHKDSSSPTAHGYSGVSSHLTRPASNKNRAIHPSRLNARREEIIRRLDVLRKKNNDSSCFRNSFKFGWIV
jgi:hypothetical protein